MKTLWLTVVIPAYNEKVNLARGTLELVAGYLVARKYPWEAVIVDDGSTDGTGQLLDDFAGMNEVYAEMMGESKPARVTIEISKLPLAALVEIEMTALAPQK